MLYSARDNQRLGTTSVEAAFVMPVAFFLTLAIVVGGMGIFKYQEMAHIARETARFASVHGAQYAKQNAAAIQAGTLPPVDENYLVDYARARVIALDPNQLNVTVNMVVIPPGSTSPDSAATVDWDNTTDSQNRSPYSAWTNNNTNPPSNVQVDNIVIVQVSCLWNPGLLPMPVTLSSTAVIGMSY
jgi:hypothetical protein